MTLSDEVLMAYADGELDARERERVARLVARDKALSARLQVFVATGHGLAPLFAAPMEAPLPEKLQRIVERARPLPAAKPRLSLSDRLRGLLAPVSPVRLAFVSAAVLATVLGATSLMLQTGPGADGAPLAGLVRQAANGQEVAQGALERALNGLASGKETQAALARGRLALVSVKLTFPDRERNYCRQYEIAVAPAEIYGGVACYLRSSSLRGGSANNMRSSSPRGGGADAADGQWAVRFQTALAPAHAPSGKAVPAGGPDAKLEAAVIAMMGGDALGLKDEEAAIAAGWKGR
jgi:hypothetical protein